MEDRQRRSQAVAKLISEATWNSNLGVIRPFDVIPGVNVAYHLHEVHTHPGVVPWVRVRAI